MDFPNKNTATSRIAAIVILVDEADLLLTQGHRCRQYWMESTVVLASLIIKASSLMETSSARNDDSQSAPLEVLKLKLELVDEIVLVLSLREESASIAASAVTVAALDAIVELFVDGVWLASKRLLQDRTLVLRGFLRLFIRALCSMLSYSS